MNEYRHPQDSKSVVGFSLCRKHKITSRQMQAQKAYSCGSTITQSRSAPDHVINIWSNQMPRDLSHPTNSESRYLHRHRHCTYRIQNFQIHLSITFPRSLPPASPPPPQLQSPSVPNNQITNPTAHIRLTGRYPSFDIFLLFFFYLF